MITYDKKSSLEELKDRLFSDMKDDVAAQMTEVIEQEKEDRQYRREKNRMSVEEAPFLQQFFYFLLEIFR